MTEAILPLDDLTQLYCDIGQHGWCRLLVAHKSQIHIYPVSGVFTDFPNEILRVCEASIENKPIRVALCDEPGGIVLEIKPDSKRHHISTLIAHKINKPLLGFDAGENGEPEITVTLRRQRLVGMLMAELWKAHIALKQPSYQQGRDIFPHKELLRINSLWNKSTVGPTFLK